MLGLRASLRRGSTTLSLAPRVNAITRLSSTNTKPQKKFEFAEEERGTIMHPYTAGHQVWNKEMLRNLNMATISELKSPLEPRTYKNIYDLPTVQELAEVGREENPWGKINKDKEFFDTWQVSNPTVPESAETAPSLVSSVLRHDGTCKRFEMNRTEALNALDLKFTAEIRKLIQQWDDAPGILTFMGHTVIPGAMFCPGSDLKAILHAGRGSKYLREFYHGVYTLASVVSSTKKPSFMVLDGPVFGNGSAFMTGQFTTTTMRTVLAVPDVLIGFFPDGGIVHKLAKLGEIGRYIALTGRRINYADLHNLGMAQYHIDTSGEVEGVQTAMGLLAHDDIYRTQVIFSSLPIEAPDNVEGTLEAVSHLIQRVFKKKSVSLMMTELQKIIEEPETTNGEGAVEWAARTLRRMKKASPVSLCVTLEYLKLAARNQMSLEDCLAMDFRLSQRFVETDDYWNGIQVACERNRSATWSYKSVEDVPSSVVQGFFRPFEDPRMEFKPVISRPKENTPDWGAYYNDFTNELTIPAPRPRIFNADGSLSLARVPIPEEKLTKEQLRAIPTTDDLYDQIGYWMTVVDSLNDAIRYDAFEPNLPELISLFKTAIISDCFSTLRKYVMDSTEVPSLMLNHANDIVLNIQAIMIGSEGPHKSTVEFVASVKDILPVLGENLEFFYDFLTPAKIPANFEDDVATLGLQAYDRGLVEDVDYISV